MEAEVIFIVPDFELTMTLVSIGRPVGGGSEGDVEVECNIINIRARLREAC